MRITIGAATGDRLAFAGFTIGPNEEVFQGATQIGVRTANGFNTNDLAITLNANATLPVVQQLLRSLTFATTTTTGSRRIAFTITDKAGADGLTSPSVNRVVNVI